MSSQHKSLTAFWRALPATLPEWPPLTAAAQTRLSWARRIETYDEVPAAFRDFFDADTSAAAFPYTVLTPSYAGFLTRATEKLLTFCDPWLHILENTGGRYTRTTFDIDNIASLEVGTVLLKSWLTLAGRTDDSTHAAATLKFNTVGDYLFAPIFDRIRGSALAAPADLAAERRHFDYLAQDHFKFMNAARRSLLPGTHVLASVMQPEMRVDLVRLFGRSLHRVVAPAHILILTDRELILVAEEERAYWSREPKYGSIRTTVPLAQILDATLAPAPHGLTLTVQLPGDQQLASHFDAGQRDALSSLLARLCHLRPRLHRLDRVLIGQAAQ